LIHEISFPNLFLIRGKEFIDHFIISCSVWIYLVLQARISSIQAPISSIQTGLGISHDLDPFDLEDMAIGGDGDGPTNSEESSSEASTSDVFVYDGKSELNSLISLGLNIVFVD
jgi:hypothetical protein